MMQVHLMKDALMTHIVLPGRECQKLSFGILLSCTGEIRRSDMNRTLSRIEAMVSRGCPNISKYELK